MTPSLYCHWPSAPVPRSIWPLKYLQFWPTNLETDYSSRYSLLASSTRLLNDDCLKNSTNPSIIKIGTISCKEVCFYACFNIFFTKTITMVMRTPQMPIFFFCICVMSLLKSPKSISDKLYLSAIFQINYQISHYNLTKKLWNCQNSNACNDLSK